MVLQVNKENEFFQDAGYKDIDRDAILAVKVGLYNAANGKAVLARVDKHNDRLAQSQQDEVDYITRYMAKRIWHYYQEPTIFMGG